MELLIFSLSIFTLGLSIEISFLCRRIPRLNMKEQAFRFHALRDELQLSAVNGDIPVTSLSYRMLMLMLNIAIRNAGLMKLRDILMMTETVRKQLGRSNAEELQNDIQRHGPKVQELASKCFTVFADMLVANDYIVRLVMAAVHSPFVKYAVLPLFRMLKPLAPTHAQAVRQAKWYSDKGMRLSPSF